MSGIANKPFDENSKATNKRLLFGINEILSDKVSSSKQLLLDDNETCKSATCHRDLEILVPDKVSSPLDRRNPTELPSFSSSRNPGGSERSSSQYTEHNDSDHEFKSHSRALISGLAHTHTIIAQLFREGRIPENSFLQTLLTHQAARTITQHSLSAGASAEPPPGLAPCTAAWLNDRKDELPVLTRRVGHPYQTRNPPRSKKPRTSFSRIQLVELEKRFQRQKYLASSERTGLAKMLKMTDAQVKTWFQNRRTKWRRQTAEEREAERQVASRLMLSIAAARSTDNKSICFRYPSHIRPDLSGSSLAALRGIHPWSEDIQQVHVSPSIASLASNFSHSQQ